jgi:hypothetical protein
MTLQSTYPIALIVAILSFYGCAGNGTSSAAGPLVPAASIAALPSHSIPDAWTISGSYHGKYWLVDGSGKQSGYVVIRLKQNGSVLTGTVNPRSQGKVLHLKLSGTVISEGNRHAEISFTFYGPKLSITVAGHIAQDRLSGKASQSGGSLLIETRRRKPLH